MKILAIETSGKTFSLSLNENDVSIASFYYNCGYMHSEVIFSLVEKLLNDTGNTFNDIDKFAVSTGPGSFTGIRIGMTAVKIFAQVLNKPVVAIDTLSILENSCIKIKGIKIIAAIDALRNEVYIRSASGIIVNIDVDKFINDFKKYKNKILIIGNAAISHKEKFHRKLGKYSISLPYIAHMPQAHTLASMAYQISSYYNMSYTKIKPLYVRCLNIEENKKM
ncbi:MAG: tRNA (adenosine(37)-N6)-threonylcarbamoyltransferase complex dimerization subunit type 1 TsaB [Endomicrobium sp.]|jgi:tRNA threonylcarbamoyladenosine biosynthesis protein TsaB|nr:tRNA (adenosine(37)-N6)-threonylcarbamoyltransferase complex dimerization subunit type 1 TsaB [Endomicrobium sp.]